MLRQELHGSDIFVSLVELGPISSDFRKTLIDIGKRTSTYKVYAENTDLFKSKQGIHRD